MFPRTDDPIADFNAYDAWLAKQREKLPKCAFCRQPIDTEECYEINEMLVCPDCLDNHYCKKTEDYIE